MHIVGEVLNQAPVTAKFVKIIATFYNANGQVIGTDFAYADPPDLAPGQRAPFDIIVLEGSVPMYQVSSYELTVDSQAANPNELSLCLSAIAKRKLQPFVSRYMHTTAAPRVKL